MNSTERLSMYGNPEADQAAFEKKWMIVVDVPKDIHDAIPSLPKRLYVNRNIVDPLFSALRLCIQRDVAHEIKTWDGCFNVRKQRLSSTLSMHSFGLAVDLNAAWNKLYTGITEANRDSIRKKAINWSEKFLQCWRDTGWNCGADWRTRLDGMHFQWDM